MTDTQRYSSERNQLNALEIELRRISEELVRVKEELTEETDRREAMEILVERYLDSTNTSSKGSDSENELDKEIKQLREVLASTKEELKDMYSQRDGVEQLLRKYLEGFGSFEAVSRLTSLIEFNPEAIVALDAYGLVLEWNPAAENVFGWKRQEIIGKSYPMINDEHQPSFKAIQKRVMRGEQIRMHEAIGQTKSGELLNVSISSMPLKNENGEIIGSSAIITDLTIFKKRADLANRLATVVEQSPNMILITDRDQIIEYVNQSFVDVTGYSVKELIGEKASIVKSDRTPEATFSEMSKILAEEGTFQGELINKKSNGDHFLVSCLISPLRSEDGKITHYASIQEDLTEISKLRKELLYKSHHDLFTGLHNEQSFKNHINELIFKAKREKTDHAIAVIDLDDFELINTNCGSKAGAGLVRKVGEIIKSNVQSADLVARLGRDLYGVLLQYRTIQQAQHQTDIIRESIYASSFKYQKQIYNITASIGLIQVNGESESVEAVIANAEFACRLAKKRGKNRSVVYSESHTEREKRQEEMEWAAKIMHVIDNDELVLLWQPITSLSSQDALMRYEALVNMNSETGKVIGASNFLPIAEKYGLSPKIDLWVIEKVLDSLSENPKILDKLDSISINLSGKSIGDSEIQQAILEHIDSAIIPPSKLCFEIGENVATNGLPEVRQFMFALKNRGCQVCIENFGTRISSFSYLHSLPFDYLKIDRSFIRDIVDSEIDRVFVRSINDVCHAMGKRTIAEYIDNDGVLEELRKIGINFAQGYAVGSPESPDKMVF